MNIDYEGQGGLTAFDVADKALKRKAGE